MERKSTFTPEKKRETMEGIIDFIAEEFKEDIKHFKTINCTGLLMRSILYDTIKIVNERFTDTSTSLIVKEEISLTKELIINKKQEDGKMEEQLIKTNITVENTNLTPIEIALGVDEEGKATARKLYDFLELSKGQFSRWAKTNILENQFAVKGEDYEGFDVNVEGNIVKDYKLSASFAKKVAIGTHNEKGEAAKDYFIKVEEKLKQKMIDTSQLSPELQAFKQIFDGMARQELKQKQLQQEIEVTKEQTAAVKQEVQGIRDVIALNPNTWKTDINSILSKIAIERGGTAEAYREVRN